jgi:hypothetical protein
LFPYFLFEFTNGTDWYKYTSLDVPQRFNYSEGPSGRFEPLGFSFDSITYSVGNIVDDASIRVDNLDQVQTSLYVGSTLQGQIGNIYAGVLSPSGTDIGALKIFSGEIDAWDLDEEELRVTLASIFSKWDSKAYGKHSSSCRWKVFGGVECQYAGGEVNCDRSYSRCDELENTGHFGGFRFLPDFMVKTLWWGPKPKDRED